MSDKPHTLQQYDRKLKPKTYVRARQRLLDLQKSMKEKQPVLINRRKLRYAEGKSNEERESEAVKRFEKEVRVTPPLPSFDSLVYQKFPCGKCELQTICPYYDPGGVCVYEVERYKFYRVQHQNMKPLELLKDFTARSLALLDFFKMSSRANPRSVARQYPIVKLTEIISNNYDRLHKYTEGEKLILESRLTQELDDVVKRVGMQIIDERRKAKQGAVDAEFIPADSFENRMQMKSQEPRKKNIDPDWDEVESNDSNETPTDENTSTENQE